MISLKLKITHKLHKYYSLSTLKESKVPVLYKTYSSSCTLLLVATNGPATGMSFRNTEELYFFSTPAEDKQHMQCKNHTKQDLGLLVTWTFCVVPPWLWLVADPTRKLCKMTLVLLNLHASSSLCYGHLLTQRLHLQPVFNGSTQPFPRLN